jgi:hypothetical protein
MIKKLCVDGIHVAQIATVDTISLILKRGICVTHKVQNIWTS